MEQEHGNRQCELILKVSEYWQVNTPVLLFTYLCLRKKEVFREQMSLEVAQAIGQYQMLKNCGEGRKKKSKTSTEKPSDHLGDFDVC